MSNMQGKICLVTGSTSGIGKVTASELAQMGATVVLVARERSKGEATKAEIAAKTNNKNLDLLLADLSSQQSIRNLANQFKAKYNKLHVLINNAGLASTQRILTEDGIEKLLPLIIWHIFC